MSAADNKKITVRVPDRVYETLSEAAQMTGATMNQFIVQSAYEKAQEIIEKERFIRMTTRSAAAFFEAIENPPSPNARLIKAAKLYRESSNASQD